MPRKIHLKAQVMSASSNKFNDLSLNAPKKQGDFLLPRQAVHQAAPQAILGISVCVIVVTMKGRADVCLWVAVGQARISLHRPKTMLTFARLAQSQAILQSIAFS